MILRSTWYGVLVSALLLGVPAVVRPQDAAPAPTPAPTPAPPAPAPKDDKGGDIIYEKARFEKDGRVTIYLRVGHQRGRLLKAILEGVVLNTPGKPLPDVTVTPNANARLLTDKGWVLESEEMHLIIVSDLKENIPAIEAALKVLDVPDPQVYIEGRIVEMRWDRDLQIGLEGDGGTATLWSLKPGSESFLKEIRTRFNPTEALTGGPFQGSTFRFQRSSAHQGSIGGVVQAFVERGMGEILSNPRIMVESGDEALVSAGERIPYSKTILIPGGSQTSVDYEEATVMLKVRPHIVGATNVHLEIDTQVKALAGFVNFPTGTAPTFTTRKAQTKVTVTDGDEIVIGGLLQKEKSQVRRGIPFLSDIPIFGVLFGKYEETESVREILFFLKPTIIQGERGPRRPLIDPERRR